MANIQRKIEAKRLKLLIFDLDGTLIDSRIDLVNSVNATLKHFERPELPAGVIATYVGDGAPMLIRRALGDPDDDAFVRQALEFFLGYYREHKLDHTHLYPGISDALAALRHGRNGAARQMAVLSNKPVNLSRQIIQALGICDFFYQVYGGNSFGSKKPDPEGTRKLMLEAGAKPEETLLIGDSAVDVLTGRNAGAWTCGVTYGFAPHTLQDAPPDVLVDSPEELVEVVG